MAEYYDFFLSYAWEDDEKPASGLAVGWVKRFNAALLRELRDLWSQRIKVFRDCDSINTGLIPDELEAALQRSVAFVCLLSSSYLTSDWCVDELGKMYAAAEADPLLPPDKIWQRFVPVLLSPIPKNNLGQLQQLCYVEAFRRTGEDDGDWELLEPSERGDGSRMVHEVAIKVAEVLRSIRGKGGALYGEKGKFFLSTSPDLEFNRMGLQASFEFYGFPVVPGEALPNDEQSYARRVTQLLTGSRASVHGFGSKLPEPVGELVPLHYEFEMAKTACASQQLARSIVWIPEKWETANKKQRDYVQHIQHDEQKPDNMAIYRVSFPELKNILRNACREIEHRPARVAAQRQVYLLYRLCDESDAHLQALTAWLEDACAADGKKTLRPLFVGDPSYLRQHDLEAREASFATLVYCGQQAFGWAESQCKLLRSPTATYGRHVFYITPGTTNFAPPAAPTVSYEAAQSFDPADADARLRAILTTD